MLFLLTLMGIGFIFNIARDRNDFRGCILGCDRGRIIGPGSGRFIGVDGGFRRFCDTGRSIGADTDCGTNHGTCRKSVRVKAEMVVKAIITVFSGFIRSVLPSRGTKYRR